MIALLERLFSVLARPLLVAAAAGAILLALYTASAFANVGSGLFAAAPYVIAAPLFLASAWLVRVDGRRGRLLAIGAAILLASWVAAIGYGPWELQSLAVAAISSIAAASTLVGATSRWLVVACGVLAAAGAALTYLHLVHPPLGLIGIYLVAGTGVSAAALSLLPRRARRWPPAALAGIAVAGWLAGAVLFLLAYGPPLANS